VIICFRNAWVSAIVIAGFCYTSTPLHAQMKQPLTPDACAGIRYLAPDLATSVPPLQLSPDGKQIAYVLQAADVASNDDNDELYVTNVTNESSVHSKPLFSAHFVAAIHWSSDNRTIAALMRRNGKTILAEIDSVTKAQKLVWEADGDVTDYSMDAMGKRIAVAVRSKGPAPLSSSAPRDDRKGYRISLAATAHSGRLRRRIYILYRSEDQHWAVERRITFESPLSGKMLEDLVDAHDMHISLSPNGRYLLMDNIENFSDVPQESEWRQSPLVRYMSGHGFEGLLVNYLYDLRTDRVSMPLKSPIVREAMWAPDSESYLKVALAPAGSRWEASDLMKDTPSDHITHMFAVEVQSGQISEVLERTERAPITWTKSGDIIARDQAGALMTLRRESDHWKNVETSPIPLPDASPYSPLSSDGSNIVMEYESSDIAPQLVAFDRSSSRTRIVAKFNPQVDNLILPKTERISWTTSTGFTAKGLLLLPPGYDPHRRYPLVIENGSVLYTGEFVCDSGPAHVSSFPRGILADSGIIYLTRYWPGTSDWETNYYPKGYPGGLAEPAFKQDLIESAVKLLDQREIIDPANVGLIGFSRGGWYVEHALTHSQIPFRAASVTDNVQYSMGTYWYQHDEGTMREDEGMYGGPPYGQSLKNWLDHSISFNLDKIHTPLLMEVMGYGKNAEVADQPPGNLAVHEEAFVGLSRLNKPVELYYYPNEQHQPEHPQARIAGLQRNVDWFRFWLQGVERAHPEDPEQYRRWELMQAQQPGAQSVKISATRDGR
jgi:dipeptidyl aminopeptidase/acylaminoacyl peptidase